MCFSYTKSIRNTFFLFFSSSPSLLSPSFLSQDYFSSHYYCPNLLPSMLLAPFRPQKPAAEPSLLYDNQVTVGKSLTFMSPSFLTYRVRTKASHRIVVKTK